MSAPKHTPGPWRLDYRQSAFSGEWFNGVVGADGEQIRVQGMTLSTGEIPMANARLIAAAPELLEALVDVMFRHVPFSDKSPYAEKARAAIAKTMGEQQ